MSTPLELEGVNLGEKHQHFNKLVKEAIATDICKIDKFDVEGGDIKNLLKIDVASKTRNVDYILKVLVCDDMLYVSRAIKQCQWLITDIEYNNIINPEYLHTTLFPKMNTKSVNKLTKLIQLNLKDTIRVEEFYEYEKRPEKGVNWLPYCSSEFILRNVPKHVNHLKILQIKRLCEKNIMVLEVLLNANNHNISKSELFESVVFLLNSENINSYLDLLEKCECYEYPKFSKSATNLIMKLDSKRIFDKFENYCNFIHLPTFIKFLKSENIKSFLLEQATKSEEQKKSLAIFDISRLKYFFESMPYEERFHFIRQIFIDKIHKEKTNLLTDFEIKAMNYMYNCITKKRWFNLLQLYQYAPFDVAFSYVKKVIDEQPQKANLNVLFSTLITTAKESDRDIYTLLQYFQNKQLNAQYKVRYQFIKDIVSQTSFHKFDQNLWDIVEDIIMVDIVGSDNEIQIFLEIVIIYKVLHSQSVPEIVEKKFQFNTLNSYKDKLDIENKVKLFEYLYNHIKTKLECQDLKTEEQLNKTIKILDQTLSLLNDWDKDLREYPLIITTIKEVVNAKIQNSWVPDLSILYNKNKSWKKWLFEESINLCPSQSVFINAIKHDPTMLERYKSEAEKLCLKEKENIVQFLRKIKIYWSQSLTKLWSDVFINKLSNLNNQKASSRGICILLEREELLGILNKYAPENPKIDYANINELNLNLQRCFAKIMYIARPQPPPEVILLYAKGDYLKFSLPSLLSIYHNLNESKSKKYISELLTAQVALQKHAIRFAFIKMKTHEIPSIFANVWKMSNNSTIRNVLFKTVHDLLCKEKDPLGMEMLWNLLEMFINNLTLNENKNIYDTLLKVSDVPIEIRAKFYVKSYTFLESLPSSKNESDIDSTDLKSRMFPYAREIIDTLPPSFVANLLLEFINNDFIKEDGQTYAMREKMRVITSYLLMARDERIQMTKYDEIFITIIKHCSTTFEENDDKSRIRIKKNLEIVLDTLCEDVKQFVFEKKLILPMKMFSAMQEELKKIFSESENYLILTKWTLAVTFTESLNGHESSDWNELCLLAAPQFSKHCYEILQEHCKKYFPRIYILFARALMSVLDLFIQNDSMASRWKIYDSLLHDEDFIPGYLTVLQVYPEHFSVKDKQAEKLRLVLLQHSSLEVKMHCNSKFLEM